SRRMVEHLVRQLRARPHRRIGNTMSVVLAKLHERVGNEARPWDGRAVVRMAVGKLSEIFEGTIIVARNTVAVGVHAAQLPERKTLAVFRRVLQGRDGARLLAEPQRFGARLERLERRGRDRSIGWSRRCAIKRHARPQARCEARYGQADKNDTRCPHNTPSLPRRPDGSRHRGAPRRPVGRISRGSRRNNGCPSASNLSYAWKVPRPKAAL